MARMFRMVTIKIILKKVKEKLTNFPMKMTKKNNYVSLDEFESSVDSTGVI